MLSCLVNPSPSSRHLSVRISMFDFLETQDTETANSTASSTRAMG